MSAAEMMSMARRRPRLARDGYRHDVVAINPWDWWNFCAAVVVMIERNAELEAQTPSALREKLRNCEEALAAAEKREAELIAERDALRETVGLFADDAQRLEFLIEKEVIPHKMGDTGLYMLVGADHCPYDGSEHDTSREAIDAARADAGNTKGGKQ